MVLNVYSLVSDVIRGVYILAIIPHYPPPHDQQILTNTSVPRYLRVLLMIGPSDHADAYIRDACAVPTCHACLTASAPSCTGMHIVHFTRTCPRILVHWIAQQLSAFDRHRSPGQRRTPGRIRPQDAEMAAGSTRALARLGAHLYAGRIRPHSAGQIIFSLLSVVLHSQLERGHGTPGFCLLCRSRRLG